jgi:quercetin dioxygenase-like cupin family protein
MDYIKLSLADAPKLPIPFDGRIVYTDENFEVVHLSLKPGEGMDLHEMPFPVVFFVREGGGTLHFRQEELKAIPGDCIRVEPGVSRGWRNTGPLELKIVVMKLLK